MGLIGAHATVTGGLATGGLAYAAEVGAEVIQVFVSNPRGWAAGPGDRAEDRALRESGIPVFIHAPYLINLGSGGPLGGGEVGTDGLAVRPGIQVGQVPSRQVVPGHGGGAG